MDAQLLRLFQQQMRIDVAARESLITSLPRSLPQGLPPGRRAVETQEHGAGGGRQHGPGRPGAHHHRARLRSG